MKRWTSAGAIALVFGILVAVLAACGRDTPPTGGESAAAQLVRIGVSTPSATHGWPAGVIWWAEEAMREHPEVRWEFQTAGNAAEQASHIDAMLVKGIDALVVLPFDSDTPLPAIRRAKEQGVFVVSVDRGLHEPVADVYIAGDNRAFGRISAEHMAEKLGGKGKIVILRGMQVEIDTERYDGAMEVFRRHPQIEVLAAEHGNWNRQTAHSVMQVFLTRFPHIDAVWASDDDMGLGVEQALKEAGRQDQLWVLGGAGMKDIVLRVKNKDPLFSADVTYPPGMIAAGVQLAVAHLKNGGDETAVFDRIPAHLGLTRADLLAAGQTAPPGQRRISIPVQLVTAENAEQFYFQNSVY